MIRFYCPDIERDATLPESDSRHCLKVLRMGVGDEVEVVDGRGGLYRCRLADDRAKGARLEIISRTGLPKVWAGNITIAVAPTKHMDRMEWLVEKLVETGVDRIVPLLCRRSERREIKRDRLEKIAVSAMKQSLKAILPAIAEMTPFGSAIADARRRGDDIWFAHCDNTSERHLLVRKLRPGVDTTIFIGPEGDFSPEETEAALAAGAGAVSLGDNRLRTETAALFAAMACHVKCQLSGAEPPFIDN